MLSGLSDRRDALTRGTVLRDYTIEAVLGYGGFGIVYRARHNEVGHLVALKEYLPAELAVREVDTVAPRSLACKEHYEDGLRRFRDEAKALINLHGHPNIVACRDFFRGNGTAYLVMDFVDGQSLSEVLREREAEGRPFDETDLLAVAVPLAEGLAHVHRTGMLHRDVKPANVLIRRGDERPILIDFGAAKQSVSEHTRSLAPYTEGYAALEQVADGELGPWTDVYGIGAVMWRIVAGGKQPWSPPDPIKVEKRASAAVRRDADPLQPAHELGADRFSSRVLAAIDDCLQLRNGQRLQDCSGLLDRLKQVDRPKQNASTLKAESWQSVVSMRPAASGRHVAKQRSVVTAMAVVVALASVASGLIFFGDQSADTDSTSEFTVQTHPPFATVSLLNSPEQYRPGILMLPGQYDVEVSALGFVTRRASVAHPGSGADRIIVLEPIATVARDRQSKQLETETELSGRELAVLERAWQRVKDSEAPEALEAFIAFAGDAPQADGWVTMAKTRLHSLWTKAPAGNETIRKTDPSEPVGGLQTSTAELYRRDCDSGDMGACCSLGALYEGGEGVVRDANRAVQLYWQACEGGYMLGCVNLGQARERGVGLARDIFQAVQLYRRACANGESLGCRQLEILEGGGVDRTPSAGSGFGSGSGGGTTSRATNTNTQVSAPTEVSANGGGNIAGRDNVQRNVSIHTSQTSNQINNQVVNVSITSTNTKAPGSRGGIGEPVFRIGAGVSSPRVLYRVEPEYSEAARNAKLQGRVLLSVDVWEDGTAHNIRVLRSLGLGLDEKAVEAIKNWRFSPGRKDGKPVRVAAQIEVGFRLLE